MPDNTDENIEPLLVNALKRGLLLGIGVCVFVILVYMINFTYLVHWSFSLSALTAMIISVVIFGNQYRGSVGGFMSFGESFQFAFVVLLTCYAVQLLFNLLLYTLIDPELSILLTDAIIENSESMFRSMGMSQEKIDVQLLRLEEEIPTQFKPLNQLMNSWIMVASSLFFGLISGLIIKRNEPIINH